MRPQMFEVNFQQLSQLGGRGWRLEWGSMDLSSLRTDRLRNSSSDRASSAGMNLTSSVQHHALLDRVLKQDHLSSVSACHRKCCTQQ
jgi:hypothetical protein